MWGGGEAPGVGVHKEGPRVKGPLLAALTALALLTAEFCPVRAESSDVHPCGRTNLGLILQGGLASATGLLSAIPPPRLLPRILVFVQAPTVSLLCSWYCQP